MIRFDHAPDGCAIADKTVPFDAKHNHVIARVSDDGKKLLGGVIFREYTGVSIEAHLASYDPHWISRDMLWVCFHYPFIKMNCRKILGYIPSSNLKALEFDLKLGFKVEARIADVYPDADMILVSMRREDCRWLSVKPRGIRARDS